MMARVLVGVVAVWALALARTAWACPVCAGRDDGNGLALLPVYAVLVLSPFIATSVVFTIIRKVSSTEQILGKKTTRGDA